MSPKRIGSAKAKAAKAAKAKAKASVTPPDKVLGMSSVKKVYPSHQNRSIVNLEQVIVEGEQYLNYNEESFKTLIESKLTAMIAKIEGKTDTDAKMSDLTASNVVREGEKEYNLKGKLHWPR